MENYLGFDIGGKNVRGVIADENGNFEKEHIVKEEGDRKNGPFGVSQQLIRIAERCAQVRKISLNDIVASAICSTGPLSFDYSGSIKDSTNVKFPEVDYLDLDNLPQGYIYNNEKLVWDEVKGDGSKVRHVVIPLVDPVSKAIEKKTHLGNDVNIATIGVVIFGEGSDYGDPKDLKYTAVCTTHGAGFGTGVWTRGGILWGVDDNAAEDGHFRIFEDGSTCGCGHEGCAETLGSGTGSANKAREKLVKYRFNSDIFEKARNRALKDFSKEQIIKNPFIVLGYVDSKLVFDVYRDNKNDRVAREVVKEVGKAIGRTYGAITCAYNPYFIATFGSLTNDWDLLEDKVKEEMEKSTNVRIPDVFVTNLGEDVGLYGAIARAMGYGE